MRITPIEQEELPLKQSVDVSVVITWKWLAAILVVIIILLVGSWAAGLQIRVSNIEAVAQTRGERIVALEGRTSLVEQRFNFIDSRLGDLIIGQKEIAAAFEKHRLEKGR